MTKRNLKSRISTFILAFVISVSGFIGCGESVNPLLDNLEFSATSTSDSVGDALGILVLDTVKILIKDIKLNVANSSQDSTNFKVGPYVLFLNLNLEVTTITSAMIPAGTYDKIKFYVHKLNSNEILPDPEFADSNGRYSVIVKGTYLGERFVYKSTKSAHQILQFSNVVQISPTNLSNNVTLKVKPYIWFINDGVYLDPRIPSNSNEIDNNIKDNINNNFRAFKDNDKNGIPD